MLSRRANLLKPSPILMLAAKAGELKASGKDVLSLTIGEPDWPTYPAAQEAGIQAIREGRTRYSPPNGIPELRKAIAAQASADLGLPYEPSQVTVTSGAKFILFSALQALVDPGDEVLIPAPFWASYTTMVELAEGRPRIVVCDERTQFKLTPELLRQGLNDKTKALLLNSPSNPTGKTYSKDELLALAKVLRDHPRVMIISDDIYNRLILTGETLAPHILHVAPDLRDRTVVMNGASKSYAMTGWRLGWALGPKAVIDAMSSYQSQSVSCASAVSQYATLAAIQKCDADVRETVSSLRKRRDSILKGLAEVPGVRAIVPEGAFYIWLDVSQHLGRSYRGKPAPGSAELAQLLLEHELVAVVPGAEFGLEGYFRLSYACSIEAATQACQRIARFFGELK